VELLILVCLKRPELLPRAPVKSISIPDLKRFADSFKQINLNSFIL